MIPQRSRLSLPLSRRGSNEYLGRVKSPRPRSRHTEPETAASLIEAVVAKIGGDARAVEHRVFDGYGEAVGELLRHRSQPEKLRGTTLFVRVGSSAIAHQLTMLKGEILQRLAQVVGPGAVTDIRTRVGTL
jgi:predicted nucleic acid-binding Zn ribbon protein